jgi:hypothetical protein
MMILSLWVSASSVGPANITQLIQEQFAQYDPSYPIWSMEGEAALNRTRTKLDQWQAEGKPKFCSEQLYAEAVTALHYYANFSIYNRSYSLLEESISGPLADSQAWALSELPSGTFGPCYTVEPMVSFNQLDPFINAWNGLAANSTSPQYTPVHSLDIWLGDGLVDYCRRHLVSNITRDGVDTREMLAAVSGDLSQIAFKRALRGLWNTTSGAEPLSDDWVERWWNFLTEEWQDVATGTWGARYVTGAKGNDAVAMGGSMDGATVQGRDLSMTFHILSYAHKDHRRAPRLHPQLSNWLLSEDFLQGIYPHGRLYHGAPCAHNDYDTARLWELVMPAVTDAALRKRAAEWLVNTTSATLLEQLKTNYLFEARMGSLLQAQYFGVGFLHRVGYFNSSARWWAADYGQAAADKLWPNATQTCCHICDALVGMKIVGGALDATWGLLRGACPACSQSF